MKGKHLSVAFQAPSGDQPGKATQAGALTENWTIDLLFCGMMPPTNWATLSGLNLIFKKNLCNQVCQPFFFFKCIIRKPFPNYTQIIEEFTYVLFHLLHLVLCSIWNLLLYWVRNRSNLIFFQMAVLSQHHLFKSLSLTRRLEILTLSYIEVAFVISGFSDLPVCSFVH